VLAVFGDAVICNHLNPAAWKHVTGDDGRVRAICPNCKQFKGYVIKQEPAKKPGKVK